MPSTYLCRTEINTSILTQCVDWFLHWVKEPVFWYNTCIIQSKVSSGSVFFLLVRADFIRKY